MLPIVHNLLSVLFLYLSLEQSEVEEEMNHLEEDELDKRGEEEQELQDHIHACRDRECLDTAYVVHLVSSVLV